MKTLKTTSFANLAGIAEKEQIKGVVFDAFGTLLFVRQPTNTYGKAIKVLKQHYSFDVDLRFECMTSKDSFEEFILRFDPSRKVEDATLRQWRRALDGELKRIEPFPEAVRALSALGSSFPKVICSNLASPYARTLEQMPEFLRVPKVWSCDHGAIKPSPALFEVALQKLGLPNRHVWMVGDSLKSDVVGAEQSNLGGAILLERSKS
jgi:HAD superfamily hydrolase (TIGR01493 family)